MYSRIMHENDLIDSCGIKRCIINNFIDKEDVLKCIAEVQQDKGKWVRYWNDNEKKMTCNDLEVYGPSLAELTQKMQSQETADMLGKCFGITPLQSDPLLHGGGIHVSGAGGELSIHLDYARHPRIPLLERRINCILYLVPEWKPEWGGSTVFTRPDGKTIIDKCLPDVGRLLAFETSDYSYHGLEPVTCPEGVERITLATYYLSVCREGITRERALFVPKRA